MNNTWTNDQEIYLEQMRLNCINLSKAHKKNYLSLKNTLKYYRIPVIIISAVNSIIAIGGQPFLEQEYISITNCGLAMICGIIGSIELFYGIQSAMETELNSQNEYYILANDIFKVLSLRPDNRHNCGATFLDDCYSRYIKLTESSQVLTKKIKDALTPIPKECETPSTPNGSEAFA